MKFCKKYQEYMQQQEQNLSGVGFKKLKKILKRCRSDCQAQKNLNEVLGVQVCHGQCGVRDVTFFASLLDGMSAVVGSFNQLAQTLLEQHLSSGFRKYFIWFKGKLHGNHTALMQEGKNLVTYALAVRKFLKKYDKECVFDPVSLTCGHIFCYMCSCSAASVSIVDGLKTSSPKEKCPLCRQVRSGRGL